MAKKKMKDKKTGRIYNVEIAKDKATVIGSDDKSVSNPITLPTRTSYIIPQFYSIVEKLWKKINPKSNNPKRK
jgi:hypothetical protein